MQFVEDHSRIKRFKSAIYTAMLDDESMLKRVQVQKVDKAHIFVISEGGRRDYPSVGFVLGTRAPF